MCPKPCHTTRKHPHTHTYPHTLSLSLSLCLLQTVETDARVAEIHANSEKFDPKAELSFKYLQVKRSTLHSTSEAWRGKGLLVVAFTTLGWDSPHQTTLII